MIELRHNTQQVIRIGVLLTKQTKVTDPLDPIFGALLEWYYWCYIIKADGTVQDISARTWNDVPGCVGCYFLTITAIDTDALGPLIVYIYDASSLGRPIFMEFEVISQNIWDSKYSTGLLAIEPQAQKG